MANDKLRILNDQLLKELSAPGAPLLDFLHYNFLLKSKFDYILDIAIKQMPDYESFFLKIKDRGRDFKVSEAMQCCEHIIGLLDLEDTLKMNIEKGNIFQGAKDKLNEASVCFRNDDYPGTINNANTCLELLLKEQFDIPTTIRKINTAKIIEIAIKCNIGPIRFFEQAKKHVTDIDNKIKHNGYIQSKLESIHAIKIMKELSDQFEKNPIKELPEYIINKIYSGV